MISEKDKMWACLDFNCEQGRRLFDTFYYLLVVFDIIYLEKVFRGQTISASLVVCPDLTCF